MQWGRVSSGLALSACITLAPLAGGCGAHSVLSAGDDAMLPEADSATADSDATLPDAASDNASEDSSVDSGEAEADRVDSSLCQPESVPPGITSWAAAFGESISIPPQAGYDPYGIAVDSQGNLVVVGSFTGVLDLGDAALASVPSPTSNPLEGDVFVVKLDPTGHVLFAKAFGDRNGSDVAKSVALDPAGNIYVVGSFQSSIDFGGGALSTGAPSASAIDIYNAFIVKLDASGNHVWSKAFGDSSTGAHGTALSVGAQGGVAIAGYFGGTIDFGAAGSFTSRGIFEPQRIASGDAFLVELSASGAPVWSRSLGATGSSQLPTSLVTDASGDIFLAGGFEGSLALTQDADSGPGPLVSSATCGPGDFTYDGFLAKFDKNGGPLWGRALVGDDSSFLTNLALDSAGNVIATGHFNGSLDIAGDAGMVPTDAGLLGPGFDAGAGCIGALSGKPWNTFVAEFDGSGARQWGYGVGAAESIGGYQAVPVALDDMDNVYVAPTVCDSISLPTAEAGTLILDAGTCYSAGGNYYGSIARLDADGYARWIRSFGDPGVSLTWPLAVAVGACPSDLYVTGTFAGATTFDEVDGGVFLESGVAPNFSNTPTWAMFLARLGR
jgi:hypothetical protein